LARRSQPSAADASIRTEAGHDRKRLHVVKGAPHFFNNPESMRYLDEATGVIGEFISSVGAIPA
jgi:hypothetical protein